MVAKNYGTVVCYRPKRARARVFTERDAARIVCRVVEQGGDTRRLRELISVCLPERCNPEELLHDVKKISPLLDTMGVALTVSAGLLSLVLVATQVLPRSPFKIIVRRRITTVAKNVDDQIKAAQGVQKLLRDLEKTLADAPPQ